MFSPGGQMAGEGGTGRRGGQFLAGRAWRELSLSSLAAGSENKRSVVKGRSDGARERQHREAAF